MNLVLAIKGLLLGQSLGIYSQPCYENVDMASIYLIRVCFIFTATLTLLFSVMSLSHAFLFTATALQSTNPMVLLNGYKYL